MEEIQRISELVNFETFEFPSFFKHSGFPIFDL